MPIVPKNLHAKFGLNMTYDKRVMTCYSGCHGKLVTIATRYVTDAYHPQLRYQCLFFITPATRSLSITN